MAMELLASGLQAFTAWLTWQNTLVNSMTPEQRTTYLGPQITVLVGIAGDFMALNKKLFDLAHPAQAATPAAKP